jgi:hypothetical protein
MLFWELGTFADGLGGGAPPGSLSGKRSRAASPLRLTQARDGDGVGFVNNIADLYPACPQRLCTVADTNVRYN